MPIMVECFCGTSKNTSKNTSIYILQAKMREDGEVPKDRIVPAGFVKILKSKATPEITQRPTGGPERIPKRADAVR